MVGLAWLSVVGEKASLTDKKACLAFPYLHSRRASVTPSKHRCSGFANMPNLVILRQNCSDRDLKIRRQRVSTTAAVSWGEWGEVAVVWREKLTLRSTVEEADGFITSFRGLSVF